MPTWFTPRVDEERVEMLITWAALWRIPPFDQVYKQLPWGALCPCGQSSTANRFGAATFPEGSTWMCGACGAEWLVLNAP